MSIPEILLRVPWKHQTHIVSKCKTIQEAIFYLNQVIEGNISRSELEHIIDANLYEHKAKALNNFESTLPQPQGSLAEEIIKDPYNLDFISMEGKFDERDLENKLAENVTRFLLELGKGFAYVGRQMELVTPSGKSYFPDMVFYHIKLKCYVVIELKVVDFMPEFIGKLNFYVSAADELLKGEDDNPSIGILLCKDKDSSVVETGFKYWNRNYRDADKSIYDQDTAKKQAQDDAVYFIQKKEEKLNKAAELMKDYDFVCLVSTIDAYELSQEWFEGVYWLECLIRRAKKSDINLTSPSDMLENQYSLEKITIPLLGE